MSLGAWELLTDNEQSYFIYSCLVELKEIVSSNDLLTEVVNALTAIFICLTLIIGFEIVKAFFIRNF